MIYRYVTKIIITAAILSQFSWAQADVCSDLKQMTDWNIKLSFAKINSGVDGIKQLVDSPEYQKSYESIYRTYLTILENQAVGNTKNILSQIEDCINDIPSRNRPQAMPDVGGYKVFRVYDENVFKSDLFNMIENNIELKSQLHKSLGAKEFNNFLSLIKAEDFNTEKFKDYLKNLSTGGKVLAGIVAAIAFISIIVTVVAGGAVTMAGVLVGPVIALVVFGGSLALDGIKIGYNGYKQNQISNLSYEVKSSIQQEAQMMANVTILNSIKMNSDPEIKRLP
jgi:hypothetical protein